MGMWWCPTVSLNTIKNTPNLQNLLIHAGGAQCSAYISSTGSIAWRSVLLTLPRQEGGRGGSEEAMVRDACCPKEGIKRGTWTSQEDKLLSDYIKAHGLGRWRSLPKNAGLNRCPKSCRLRWLNYLRPGIKRGNIAEEEEELIIRLHNLLGNRWSLIAGRLPGRTDNEIKNYWNTCLRKKASGDISKKHRKPANKKSPDRGVDKEKPTNIIRTRAVRCTRFVYKSEVPTMTPNSLGSSSPSIQSEAELQQSLHPQIACLPPVQFDMDGIFTDYGTQNSPSSNIEDIYMVGSGSNSTDDIDVPLSEHWFDVRGIHDGNMEEEILQYLTEETWDTMLQDVMSSP